MTTTEETRAVLDLSTKETGLVLAALRYYQRDLGTEAGKADLQGVIDTYGEVGSKLIDEIHASIVLSYGGTGKGKAKANTHKVYHRFCEISRKGYALVVYPKEECEWIDKSEDYTFLCEVEIPPVDRNTVIENGVRAVDQKIAVTQGELEILYTQKQELLALPAPEEVES